MLTSGEIEGMEIGRLQPGMELNKLVAERVLGWRYDSDWDCLIPPEQTTKPSNMWTDWQRGKDENGEYYTYREPAKDAHVSGIRYSGDFTKIILPDFSSDIAAAWLVVDGLGGNHLLSIYHDGQLWVCEFHDGQSKHVASAETAPHAICLAALKSESCGS